MKAYLVTTGILFAVIAVLYVWRIVAELLMLKSWLNHYHHSHSIGPGGLLVTS